MMPSTRYHDYENQHDQLPALEEYKTRLHSSGVGSKRMQNFHIESEPYDLRERDQRVRRRRLCTGLFLVSVMVVAVLAWVGHSQHQQDNAQPSDSTDEHTFTWEQQQSASLESPPEDTTPRPSPSPTFVMTGTYSPSPFFVANGGELTTSPFPTSTGFPTLTAEPTLPTTAATVATAPPTAAKVTTAGPTATKVATAVPTAAKVATATPTAATVVTVSPTPVPTLSTTMTTSPGPTSLTVYPTAPTASPTPTA